MEKMSRERQIYKVTIIGSIANFVLLVFKFVAGVLGKSSAMIARCGTFSVRFCYGYNSPCFRESVGQTARCGA